jgi:hypothetical protein
MCRIIVGKSKIDVAGINDYDPWRQFWLLSCEVL